MARRDDGVVESGTASMIGRLSVVNGRIPAHALANLADRRAGMIAGRLSAISATPARSGSHTNPG